MPTQILMAQLSPTIEEGKHAERGSGTSSCML